MTLISLNTRLWAKVIFNQSPTIENKMKWYKPNIGKGIILYQLYQQHGDRVCPKIIR